ncbi:MAG: M48 family metallopeptidase [Vicinamibacterales bacterium]
MTARMSTWHFKSVIASAAVVAMLASGSAQTRVVPPDNQYSPQEDVQLGQEAAAQARKELPLLDDALVDEWVEDIGERLIAAMPAELRHPEFRYSFDQVNQKEINAFALPGGPMFLNRGMIEAAKTEGEVAGVMAHELSHVALRHGTAQATKGEKFQIGAVAGQILGAIVGGTAGSIIAQGSQFGLGAYFLKYGREYETQADILGAQIMARAGYDPREMANMFRTIEAEGGGGGPEWLSSHPNPGNRYNAINREAQSLRVVNPRTTGEFDDVQARLDRLSPAYTAEQIAQMQETGRVDNGSVGTSGRRTVQVASPSTRYQTYQAGNALRISVPGNWAQFGGGNNTVTYAPEGAFFQGQGGGTAFTHGVQLGVTQGTGNLQRDTQALLRAFAQSNPQLQQSGGARRDNVGGRTGLTVTLANVSDVTGQREVIQLSTTQLRDNSLLYVIGVAPQAEANAYVDAFARVRQNLRINDR